MQNIINKIIDRYNKLGYSVKPINYKIVDTFSHQEVGDLNPLCINKTNTTIFIDDAAYIDLIKNKKAIMFYLAHEIAHAAANANHENKKFVDAINKYNEAYPQEKTVNDPTDEYNKKYLPTFYKKDKWLDNAKSIEQAKIDFKNKTYLKENQYFKY